ncbi:GNAT family N-acetyltransferase [Paenibacillus pinistramenti]|uniref:GNAT family N-acetyltransferase n=1 Tax=Paenibacillus pinistramenti TaxID=1768003 RepID=UPI001108DFE4|nr:GNAT family N-acetyltransferase [Paenibacillus pinistramenti]
MLEIKRLSTCSLDETVQAWNEGFRGYAFDAATTPDAFLKRLAAEELSSELSIVAFQDGIPAGIVLNGIREAGGKSIGWNGGTGVAFSFRGQGIGERLIAAALNILQENGVHLATLEALSDNTPAVTLYRKMGYAQVDELEHLSLKGPAEQLFTEPSAKGYEIVPVHPAKTAGISFYKASHPWQTQWQNARDGQAVIVRKPSGQTAGYAYWRKVYNPAGEHTATILHQCEAEPGNLESALILKVLLWHIFGDLQDSITRTVPNLPKSGSALTGLILKSLGFTPVVQQIYMTKAL